MTLSNHHSKLIIFVIIVVIAVFFGVDTVLKNTTKVVQINDTVISYKAAITNEEKAVGLSKTSNLPENEGMLFFFNQEAPSFWMKDMSIPIDIIWISNGKVVKIDSEVQPPTNPDEVLQTYPPPFPIDYVLEVNSGFASRHNIVVGEEVKVN